MATRKRRSVGLTKYSSEQPGDPGNYKWPCIFYYNEDGYLGISQSDDAHGTSERVLLSPGQLAALRLFIRRKPRPA